MNDFPDQDEEQEVSTPDPNVYQPEEDEDDEIDRRIRRAKERISRLTIVGSPDIDVEGAWDGEGNPHGYAVNYKPLGACCLHTGCRVLSESQCNSEGGIYIGNGTACIPNPCGFVCPDVDAITVTFDGVLMCGCYDNGSGGSALLTDISFNGSFVLPRVSPGLWTTLGGMVHLEIYPSPDTTCSGSHTSFDLNVGITVYCADADNNPDPVNSVGLFIESDQPQGAIFLSLVSPILSGRANQVLCSTPVPPNPFVSGNGSGFDGTAAITF